MVAHRALPQVDPRKPRGRLYLMYARMVDTPVVAWISQRVGWKLDPQLMRLTRGRLGVGLMIRTAVLETRGARTGKLRRNVLIYFHDADRVTVVASKLGLERHPAWFHNACAHPDVVFGGHRFRAEVVHDESERERLWALADQVFPAYSSYRDRAARMGRTIPILQLVPDAR